MKFTFLFLFFFLQKKIEWLHPDFPKRGYTPKQKKLINMEKITFNSDSKKVSNEIFLDLQSFCWITNYFVSFKFGKIGEIRIND
jgi:hypothetical protein